MKKIMLFLLLTGCATMSEMDKKRVAQTITPTIQAYIGPCLPCTVAGAIDMFVWINCPTYREGKKWDPKVGCGNKE